MLGRGTAIVRAARLIAACMLACALAVTAGCQSGGAEASEPTGAAFNPPATLAMPVVSAKGDQIDVDHVADGYVVVHYVSDTRLKFQASKDDMVYNYDFPADGTPTVFPLNMGDGPYLLRIMKNTSGNDYVEVDSKQINVALSSEFAPYLIPNQYCAYDESSACVAKARELTNGAENQADALSRVCNYVMENVSYDTAKAEKLSTVNGYIPNPDETLATGEGVCFDYASLGAAMLRSLGFPTKIITGYVSPGDLYHAWIMVYVDGSWKTGEFSVNPDTWSRVDLTFAASGSTEFTGDGTSYTERYVY